MAEVHRWKWVYGFKHKYKLTSEGELFRLEHTRDGIRLWEKKIYPYYKQGKAYVRIFKNKKEHKYNLAKLVRKTFKLKLPKPYKEAIVHLDGITMNCSVNNLRVVPLKEAQNIAKFRRDTCNEYSIDLLLEEIKGKAYIKKGRYIVELDD